MIPIFLNGPLSAHPRPSVNMTDDLKGLIVTIADLDRGDMVRMLMAASDRCEKAMELARTKKQARVRRGPETEMATRQHLDAFSKMERLRRIIFFLASRKSMRRMPRPPIVNFAMSYRYGSFKRGNGDNGDRCGGCFSDKCHANGILFAPADFAFTRVQTVRREVQLKLVWRITTFNDYLGTACRDVLNKTLVPCPAHAGNPAAHSQ